MNLVKPCKIQVPAVHQIKDASLDDELIEDVDFVGLPVCHVKTLGIFPCKSKRVCTFTAALVVRNGAQE